MSPTEFQLLLDQYTEETISGKDYERLWKTLREPEYAAQWDAFAARMWDNDSLHPLRDPKRDIVLQKLIGMVARDMADTVIPRIHFLRSGWLRYAAAILIVFGAGTYLWFQSTSSKTITVQPSLQQPTADILPGGNKAILTLADGSTIVLDSAASGPLAEQGRTRVLKVNAGSVAYKVQAQGDNIGFNTISTPKGGQYQITLPDGTQVWLNAASSIRFPTAFAAERKVIITGEVYFEIAADKSRPFYVQAATEQIQVLGTSFNVNAYSSEPAVRTSLLQGAVKIDKIILKPGQAYMAGKVVPADTGQDIAWKNGVFNFNDVTLEQALKQLANWYDIEVSCPPSLAQTRFGGEMGRDLTLNQVVRLLKVENIRFHLEGRHLSVTP